MKTSVALCSYNGERYIGKQLESILFQTLPVDEIVICDDGSSDNTLSIVNAIRSQTDILIRLYVNDKNIGCRANFQKALGLCIGDIIFFSDQDDIWIPDKVERIMKWFGINSDKEVVFTNGTYIDSVGNPCAGDSTLFFSYGMTRRAKRWMNRGFAMELFLKNNKATGATMAIRRTILNDFHIDSSSDNDTPYHDAQISMFAIQRNSLGYISDCLIQYRIHEGQDCGVKNITDPMKTDNVLSPLNDYMILGEYLTNDELIDRYKFINNRREWVLSGSFLSVLKHSSDYFHFYNLLGALCFSWDIALCAKFSIVK